MPYHLVIILALICTTTTVLFAQDPTPTPDRITDTSISYDQTVSDTITEHSSFDLWHFQAGQGEIIEIVMEASDGLAPLFGIFDSRRDLITATNLDSEGNELFPAAPNDTIRMQFQIPEAGEYIINATRAGNDDGTTTGSYDLTINLIASGPTRINTNQDVTFRCGDHIATTATTINFIARPDVETYRVSVYGLDDFQPVIRVEAGRDVELQDCANDSQSMGGDTFTLPGDETNTLPDGDTHLNAAQMSLRGENLDQIELTIASIEGHPGRYMVVIDGFQVSVPEDSQQMSLRLGPSAVEGELIINMVQGENTRIDPYIEWIADGHEEPLASCDDAGRRGCENVPSFVHAGVVQQDGTIIIGDRFSAGIRLAPGHPDPNILEFSSRARNATGEYAIILIGELPN